MRLTQATILAVCALNACANHAAVDASQAISLANHACYEWWGKMGEENGVPWTRRDWHAKLAGDHWTVWDGDEALPSMVINVPLNGRKPDPRTCKIAFTD